MLPIKMLQYFDLMYLIKYNILYTTLLQKENFVAQGYKSYLILCLFLWLLYKEHLSR